MDAVLLVQGEHHYWPTCPCISCEQYRQSQRLPHAYESRLVSLSPDAASVLFSIPRSPTGSYARALREGKVKLSEG